MEINEYLMTLLNQRTSTRNFGYFEIDSQTKQKLIRAIDSGPSAGGLRAYSVWETDSKEDKIKLEEATLEQGLTSSCSLVFCICSVPEKSIEKYGRRGNLYSIQDATIAGMAITYAATALGLDSCWIGSIDKEKVKRIFFIPSKHIPLSLICIGKRK